MISTFHIILIILIIACIIFATYYYFGAGTEPFIVNPTPPSPDAVVTEIEKMKLPTIMVSAIKPCSQLDYPLSQYAIKASYNSANSGKYMSKDAVKYVITRGCRLLDFEVFIDQSGGSSLRSPSVAVVSYTTAVIKPNGDNQNIKLDSYNTIPLDDVFTACIHNAFSASVAPNYADPLFIHLRLKTGNVPLEPIVNSIKFALMEKLYVGDDGNAIAVTSETKLRDIMGKVVLVVDARVGDIALLHPYINVMANTPKWKRYHYRDIDNMASKPPQLNIENAENAETTLPTDVTELSMVAPSSNMDTIVPSPFSVIAEYGIQTMAVPFYSVNNQQVILYEQLFNTVKGGVVPLSVAISYSMDMLAEKPVTKMMPHVGPN